MWVAAGALLTEAVRTDIKYAKNSVTFCPS